jgi:hypothetical protein
LVARLSSPSSASYQRYCVCVVCCVCLCVCVCLLRAGPGVYGTSLVLPPASMERQGLLIYGMNEYMFTYINTGMPRLWPRLLWPRLRGRAFSGRACACAPSLALPAMRFGPCAPSHALTAMRSLPCASCHAPSAMRFQPCASCHALPAMRFQPWLPAMRFLPCASSLALPALRFLPCACCHALPALRCSGRVFSGRAFSGRAVLAAPASQRRWPRLAPFGRAFLAAPLGPRFPRLCTAGLLKVGVLVGRVARGQPLRGLRRGWPPLAPSHG